MGSKIAKKNFTCFKDWIERFKQRHCITGGKVIGESASVGMNVIRFVLTTNFKHVLISISDRFLLVSANNAQSAKIDLVVEYGHHSELAAFRLTLK